MNIIDYPAVVANLKQMINILEFDSMRSPGKAKLNSQHLQAMYDLVDRYEKMLPKPAAKKED